MGSLRLLIAYIMSATRGAMEQCVKWAHQRKAFGKKLIQRPVVRQKLAHSIAELESVQSWYENITYQCSMALGVKYSHGAWQQVPN